MSATGVSAATCKVTAGVPPSGKLRFYEEGSCKSEVIVTLELSGREEIIGFKQLRHRCEATN